MIIPSALRLVWRCSFLELTLRSIELVIFDEIMVVLAPDLVFAPAVLGFEPDRAARFAAA